VVEPWRGTGLRVVELGSGISAAYGARLLADFGADVIKVEPPAGDETRRAGPFPQDEPHPEKSGHFLYLNFNKRGITLDITTDTGAALLARLLAEADVLVENLGAGKLAALPLPDGALHERLVVCSISTYGQDGPKAGYLGSEVTAYASGGMMYITGDGLREPLKQGLNQAAHLAGVNAAAATLAAVLGRRLTGRGQRIDISEQETVAWITFPALNLYSHTGGVMKRGPGDVPRLVNSRPMEAKDGWIMPSYAGLGTWWEPFAAYMEQPELAAEHLLTPAGRQMHAAEIDRIAGPRLKERTKQEIFHGGQEAGLTLTALQDAGEVVECPHLGERDFFVEQHHPVAGVVRMPGMAPFASNTPRTPVAPAPLLGQHTAEVLGALGLTPAEILALTGAGIV
jgi:crotonobetainyl-CoA:carnitine CoA-transferase CaiB-like acyl-CoA transferase